MTRLQGEPSEPGKIAHDVFGQDVYWWDRHGVRHAIDDMDDGYRKTVAAFLLRRAHHWELVVSMRDLMLIPTDNEELATRGGFLSDGVAAAAMDMEAELMHRADDPEAWLRGTPLLRRLLEDS